MIHLRNLIFLCRLGFAFISYLCIIATLMNQLILSLFQREAYNKLGVGVGGRKSGHITLEFTDFNETP